MLGEKYYDQEIGKRSAGYVCVFCEDTLSFDSERSGAWLQNTEPTHRRSQNSPRR